MRLPSLTLLLAALLGAPTPAAATLRAQQRRFDAFHQRYNDERPHEALNGQTPSARWYPSARPFPERLAAPEYPAHLEVRRVSTAGTSRGSDHCSLSVSSAIVLCVLRTPGMAPKRSRSKRPSDSGSFTRTLTR